MEIHDDETRQPCGVEGVVDVHLDRVRTLASKSPLQPSKGAWLAKVRQLSRRSKRILVGLAKDQLRSAVSAHCSKDDSVYSFEIGTGNVDDLVTPNYWPSLVARFRSREVGTAWRF